MNVKKIISATLFACLLAISSPAISNPVHPFVTNNSQGKIMMLR